MREEPTAQACRQNIWRENSRELVKGCRPGSRRHRLSDCARRESLRAYNGEIDLFENFIIEPFGIDMNESILVTRFLVEQVLQRKTLDFLFNNKWFQASV
jgi:hypothetical protein